jgi:2-isopropylmalate synthase
VIVEMGHHGHVETEATIKIWIDDERYVCTAEGNGPVNALDTALRQAIGNLHPHLADIELENFKVRLVDETHGGTAAITRVLIDATDGEHVWGSIGVSENVIVASWQALLDSLEYSMQSRRRPGREATARPTPQS